MTRNQIFALLATGAAVGGAIWWLRSRDKNNAAVGAVGAQQALALAAQQAQAQAQAAQAAASAANAVAPPPPPPPPPAYTAMPPPPPPPPLTPGQQALSSNFLLDVRKGRMGPGVAPPPHGAGFRLNFGGGNG